MITITVALKKTDNLIVPTKAHETDAGYDVTATSDPTIVGQGFATKQGYGYSNIDYIEYDTNIFIAPPDHNLYGNTIAFQTFHTLVHPRSSISKTNLLLANSVGVIDNGYRDSIKLRFKYIYQPEDLILLLDDASKLVVPRHIKALTRINMSKVYKKGHKIGQLLFNETLDVNFKIVDELPSTERDTGGFGSTDVKK